MFLTSPTREVSPPAQFSGRSKIEQLLGDLRKLPLLPATASQALSLARDESTKLPDFARLVERDVTLASSLLKLANNPLFSPGRPVDTLEQAVVRVGLRECQNLILAASMRNLFQQTDPVTKGHCSVLWQHCFLTACFCRRLNQELRFDYKGEEFTAGLLHDLGRILLAVTLGDQFEMVDPMTFREESDLLDRERGTLETDHCQLGTAYAKENRFPAATIAAIRHHHDLYQSQDHRGLIGLVAASDHLANHLQRREKPEDYNLEENPGFQFLTRGWNPEQIQTIRQAIPRLIEETLKAAQQKNQTGKPASGDAGKGTGSRDIPRGPGKPAPASPGKSWFKW